MITRKMVLASLIFAGIMAAAGGVAGEWDNTALTPDGEALKFILKVREEGGKLSGTADDRRGAMPLIEPKLEDSTLSFKLDYNGARYTLVLKISGDKLEGTYTGEAASGKISGTRRR